MTAKSDAGYLFSFSLWIILFYLLMPFIILKSIEALYQMPTRLERRAAQKALY
jgi:ABC-type spermidine/putrescine transport system permease subunit I